MVTWPCFVLLINTFDLLAQRERIGFFPFIFAPFSEENILDGLVREELKKFEAWIFSKS